VQAIDRDLNYSEPASVKLEVMPDPRNHRIAQLEGELAEREREEMERIYRELEDARYIQQSLLPKEAPQIADYEIAGVSLPAKEVSGDFYDYLSLGQDVAVVLADVTGKSVKAAMIAAMSDGVLHTAVRERRDVWDSPSRILTEVNIGLQPRLMRGMFTAMSLGIIRADERKLMFSNAGMPYPIVKRGKKARELEAVGMPLGLMEGAEYSELSTDLEEGDFVVFYSDGVIEATDEAGEMYQTERLLELIQQADPGISAQEMVDLIVRDVGAFVGDEEASDDITVVVLRCGFE
jgi:serine phosphatase RsbU (regulator of sigma subunit)